MLQQAALLIEPACGQFAVDGCITAAFVQTQVTYQQQDSVEDVAKVSGKIDRVLQAEMIGVAAFVLKYLADESIEVLLQPFQAEVRPGGLAGVGHLAFAPIKQVFQVFAFIEAVIKFSGNIA